MPSGNGGNTLLLDTHVWLWLANGSVEIERTKARPQIDAAARGGSLYVSVISAWEISLLVRKRRLTLPTDSLAWINQSLRESGIGVMPLTAEIAVASNSLPGTFHGDPADRIIVATARQANVVLVTADREIRAYPHVQTAW